MCFALFAWFALAALLAGIAKAWTGLLLNALTQMYFSKQPFS